MMKKKSAEPIPICSFCLGNAEENKKTSLAEELVSCADCGVSGHPTCLLWPEHMLASVRLLRWQCLRCKLCTVCEKKGRQRELLLCDFCDRGFHMLCCSPQLSTPPEGTWKCNLCMSSNSKEIQTNQSELPTPSSSDPKLPARNRHSKRCPCCATPTKSRRTSTLSLSELTNTGTASTSDMEDVSLKLDISTKELPKPVASVDRKRLTPLKKVTGEKKQGKKRQPKSPAVSVPIPSPTGKGVTSDVKVKRPRGRPRKNWSAVTLPDNDVALPFYDPGPVTDCDRELFADTLKEVQNVVELIPSTTEPTETATTEPQIGPENDPALSESTLSRPVVIRCPSHVQLGMYSMETWYSAPYPDEFARLAKLYICEYCLKTIKTSEVYNRHLTKCPSNFPPGNEIYRHGNVSVWEVFGSKAKSYSQNLCLLSKLFLDHKTLYHDVDPFVFYVITVCDANSCHLVGYFSREKRPASGVNLCCIMVLPPYQKHGYGRFMIDFSYLLSRVEGVPGSPEKPLSALGGLSYRSYWRSKVLPLIWETLDTQGAKENEYKRATITVARISEVTGMHADDVAETLQEMGKVEINAEGWPKFTFDSNFLATERIKLEERKSKWIPLEGACLKWFPPVQEKDVVEAERSADLSLSNILKAEK